MGPIRFVKQLFHDMNHGHSYDRQGNLTSMQANPEPSYDVTLINKTIAQQEAKRRTYDYLVENGQPVPKHLKAEFAPEAI